MDGRRFLSGEGTFVADLPVRYFGSHDSNNFFTVKITHFFVKPQSPFASLELNYFFLKITCYLAADIGAFKVVRLFIFFC